MDGAQGPFTVRITTSGSGYRRWNIKVTQIECANPSRAPANCLQHFTGPSGQISSFNYDMLIRYLTTEHINRHSPIIKWPNCKQNHLNQNTMWTSLAT